MELLTEMSTGMFTLVEGNAYMYSCSESYWNGGEVIRYNSMYRVLLLKRINKITCRVRIIGLPPEDELSKYNRYEVGVTTLAGSVLLSEAPFPGKNPYAFCSDTLIDI